MGPDQTNRGKQEAAMMTVDENEASEEMQDKTGQLQKEKQGSLT